MTTGLLTLAIVLVAIVVGILITVPPLGPVTVLVIRQALQGDPSGAMKVGLGRVPAEVFYCALATFGIVALLEQVPGARTVIEAIGAVVFLAVGIWLLMQQPKPPAAPTDAPFTASLGYGTGFTISILNPTLILSWSAVVAIGLSMTDLEPTLAQKLLFPIALGVGIVLGYLILIRILKRYGPKLEARFVRLVIRSMGAVFVAMSLWSGLAVLGVV